MNASSDVRIQEPGVSPCELHDSGDKTSPANHASTSPPVSTRTRADNSLSFVCSSSQSVRVNATRRNHALTSALLRTALNHFQSVIEQGFRNAGSASSMHQHQRQNTGRDQTDIHVLTHIDATIPAASLPCKATFSSVLKSRDKPTKGLESILWPARAM